MVQLALPVRTVLLSPKLGLVAGLASQINGAGFLELLAALCGLLDLLR